MKKIYFGSENFAGTNKEILEFLNFINDIGHVHSYGDDCFTQEAIELFKKEFNADIDVYFLYNGTAANTLALKTMTNSYNSIICSDIAHINIHEVTAPHTFTGCKIIPLKSFNGKINVNIIRETVNNERFWGRHTAMPKAVTITQPTEIGTLYTNEEIKAIADYCHENELYLHIDGARISNACVALGMQFNEIKDKWDCDVLTFGATKNGLMFGEALIFFNKFLSKNFDYIQKQGLQLNSKMRFLSGQFIPYFKEKLWEKNASNSNEMCKILAEGIRKIYPKAILYPVEANIIFAEFNKNIIDRLTQKFEFYIYDINDTIIRLITSFDTRKEDVLVFIDELTTIYKDMKRGIDFK